MCIRDRIDALPLARACIELEGLVKGRQDEAIDRHWPLLLEVIASLRSDIQAVLDD